MKNLSYLFILSFLIISCEEEVPPVTYTLTTQVTPDGAGSVTPSSGTYDEGESVTITANPSANYIFKQWTGTGSGTANPLTFKIISNTTVTAEFELIDTDGDGVTDALDKCPDTPAGSTVNTDGCATSQLDSDGDGVMDDKDKCPDTLENTDVNEDGCSYIYLAENGVTIKAYPYAKIGEKYNFKGESYIIASNESIGSIFTDYIDQDLDFNNIITTFVTQLIGLIPKDFNSDISTWDISNVTNMALLFQGSSFNNNISSWDVSNVINMASMFQGSSFNNDIGSWDVSNVTRMDNMFKETSAFNQDISNWDVSNVTTMSCMFFRASAFNQPIGNWDVSNVKDMVRMFAFTESFNQPIGSWDVSNVTDMSGMFRGSVFNQDIGSWDITRVLYFNSMFKDNNVFNQDISTWDCCFVEGPNETFSSVFMSSMFEGSVFNQDISNWDVRVIEINQFLKDNKVFNQDLSNWKIYARSCYEFKLGATNLYYLFQISLLVI